ncbi:hypothetical protein [Cryptosporangium minutisporangium]|uniref:Uncharacterized protein n=1 Tax=Cryptosporangium minutisporangium TaxID=113569 RepID=A0ABP6SUF7_9ACTN
MAAAGETGSSPPTFHCCLAHFTDRLGDRHSLVVAPGRSPAPASYTAWRERHARLEREAAARAGGGYMLTGLSSAPPPPKPEEVRRDAVARLEAERDLAARHIEVSQSVRIDADEQAARAWIAAADDLLDAVDAADAALARSEARARRTPLLADRLRERARRRYRQAVATAAETYREAVGELPDRVRIAVAVAVAAAYQRQLEIERERARKDAKRRQATATADARRVWRLLVRDRTAYVKRSDVTPTTRLPKAEQGWGEPLTPSDLAHRLAQLLYQRLMVAPQIFDLVWDDAAVRATRRQLNAGGAAFDGWWAEHYRRAERQVSDFENRHRRGGYSAGGFV